MTNAERARAHAWRLKVLEYARSFTPGSPGISSRAPCGMSTSGRGPALERQGGTVAPSGCPGLLYPLSLVPSPLSLIPYPLSLIPYPLSLIPYPLSLIPYPLSLIPYPLSLSPYPLSLIPYPLSLIPYPLSLIPYPLSLLPSPPRPSRGWRGGPLRRSAPVERART
jgi:hypothetical protein